MVKRQDWKLISLWWLLLSFSCCVICLLVWTRSSQTSNKNMKSNKMLPSNMNNCDDNSNGSHQNCLKWHIRSIMLQFLLLYVIVTLLKIKFEIVTNHFLYSTHVICFFQKYVQFIWCLFFWFLMFTFFPNVQLFHWTLLPLYLYLQWATNLGTKNGPRTVLVIFFSSTNFKLILIQKAKRVLIQNLLTQFKFFHSITNKAVNFVNIPSPTF